MTLIRNIVAPIDFSETADTAVGWAASLSKQFNATLHLVHAFSVHVPGPALGGMALSGLYEEIRQGAEERLEKARERAEQLGASRVTNHLCETPDPSLAVRAQIQAGVGDLVVMGAHGHRGFKHALLGSIAERTIRSVQCPVLAVKTGAPEVPSFDHIVVPTDFSKPSVAACDFAVEFASAVGASVELVHAVEVPPDYIVLYGRSGESLEEAIWSDAAARLEAQAAEIGETKVQISQHLERGVPDEVIAKRAEDSGASMIVMGTRGQTGLAHFLVGSVAERTLRSAPCSVLAVHGETS